jgi:hypothetical protein
VSEFKSDHLFLRQPRGSVAAHPPDSACYPDVTPLAGVAPGAVSGVARVQQNGRWSNALPFTVPVPPPGGNSLVPNVVSMVVGETRTLQARDAAGQPATGLTWTSSDPAVVSLSGDTPPVLAAVAPGHVTIVAGSASADVTVYADSLPLGTVIWSNPVAMSGWDRLVPAVPSATGVADVFAFHDYSGTVEAITADGGTAWTGDVSNGVFVPDFQGGLVGEDWGNSSGSIVKMDGMTGQRRAVYTPTGTSSLFGPMAVHTDGTVFALQQDYSAYSVVGVDSASAGLKFSVPVATPSATCFGRMIVAGDGYAYLPYMWIDNAAPGRIQNHLRILRVSSAGASDVMPVRDWTTGFSEFCGFIDGIITNGDTGVLLTFTSLGPGAARYMAITNGTSVSVVRGPGLPDDGAGVEPVLQAQDGSFVGTWWGPDGNYMVAFDAGGGVRWMVPDEEPRIATEDGGVIGSSGTVYDQNGSAVGQILDFAAYSWPGNTYSLGSVIRRSPVLINTAASFWPQAGANRSGNWTAKVSDWKGTDVVNQQKLTRAVWSKFKGSTCMAVLGNSQGLGPFAVDAVWQMQQKDSFYDLTREMVALWTLDDITGHVHNLQVPPNHYSLTLQQKLGNGNAATLNLGAPGPILLTSGLLNQATPQYTLAHEVLIHSYKGWTGPQVYANAWFAQNRLWNDQRGSTTITTWMSADCRCTPGAPGDAGKDPVTGGVCDASNRKW